MRIKVGDTFLDMDNSIIAQTYAVNQIGSIETRQGGFSNNFTLPLTANNQYILGIPGDINSASRNPYTKVDATLYDNGIPVADGYLKYQVVNRTTIQVSFFSDNSDWFNAIKGKKLSDLDLSAYDHDYTYTNAVTAINADKDSGYTYPLIDYGEFGAAADLKAAINQIYPGMFLLSVINQIFYDIGWKISGEVTEHPLYKRMFIPFSGKAFSHSAAYISENSETTAKDVDQLFGTGGSNATWAGGGTNINSPVDGTFNIVVQLNVDEADIIFPPINYDVDINVNGSPIKQIVNSTLFDQIIIVTADNVELVTADNVTVTVRSGANLVNIFATSSDISLLMTPLIAEGTEIQMASIMPDIKQSDLLKYVAFIFGGIFQANNNSKTVTLSFFRSIIGNTTNASDWSDKIDSGGEVDFTELLSGYASKSIITYKEDTNDEELQAYENETGERFGQGQIDIANEHIEGLKTIYEAPFSPMININSFSNKIYIPQIRYKTAAGELEVTPSPKIGILSTNIGVDLLTLDAYADLEITNVADSSSSTVTDIPFLWFAKTTYTIETDALIDSLAFDQIAFPNVVGEPLKDRFLGDYEEILNSVKYLKANFHLTEVDINVLDFTIPVYIERYKAYFYISKINNFQGSRRVTECELVKIG